ncbi:hypothetical protein CTI12_AA467050 [Artemisia annua]|uniref:Uncharacterized protein n=1 Tax=Artemisia annua TaxID=35608 RepID=A0A2U1LPX4_ARTAN|nr:hypothetical protein CTI12_AA467050 [Artemisia annua]
MAGNTSNNNDPEKGIYALIKDTDNFQQGLYDKPMPCFGTMPRFSILETISGRILGNVKVLLPLQFLMFTDMTVIVIAGDGMFSYLVQCSNDPIFLADLV